MSIFDAPTRTETERKIASFESLPEGWRYGSGLPIPQHRVAAGIRACRFLYQVGITRTDAFAGEGGEVMVTGYHKNDCIEIIIEADNRYTIAHERDDEELVYRPKLERGAAIKVIADIAKAICSTSDSSIPTTTTGTASVSSVWPFVRPATAGSQLSNANVLLVPEHPFANTSGDSTPLGSIPTLSSSGPLMLRPYHPQAA
jgi:hypothetical protein